MKKLVALLLCLLSVAESLVIARAVIENVQNEILRSVSLDVSNETKVAASRTRMHSKHYFDSIVEADVRKVAWMLGCSLDSQAFVLACKNAGAAIMPNHMEKWSTVSDLAFKWCKLHDVMLVFTFHPGATPPPYYDFYAFNQTTEDIVRTGAQQIIRLLGKPPDAILVDSSLWDMANWWQKAGSPKSWPTPHSEISHWASSTIPAFLDFVQSIAPSSSVAFRSPAPMFPSCIDPWWYTCQGDQIVNEMHACLTKSVDNVTLRLYGKYHFIDYYSIVLSKHEVLGGSLRGWYADTIHPGGELANAYMSDFLRWAKSC